MARGESLIGKVDGYRVDIETFGERVRVEFAGVSIVDTASALLVLETAHDPVFYFPREAVAMEYLEASDHTSFCPFKGEASYWSLRVGDETSENAVWSYEDPFEEAGALRDCVSFYPDRVSGLDRAMKRGGESRE